MTGHLLLDRPAGTVPSAALVRDRASGRTVVEAASRSRLARLVTSCFCACSMGLAVLAVAAPPAEARKAEIRKTDIGKVEARKEDKATRLARQASIKRTIVQEAIEHGVSPALALAVAHAESQFRPWVKSRKGARGVMQLLPSTAEGEFGVHPKHLWDADTNVETGVKFLKQLIKRYGDEKSVLSHYNGGRSTNPREQAQIWRATRPYIVKVQNLKKTYQASIDRHGLAHYLGRNQQPGTRIADDDARAGRNEVLMVHLPPLRPEGETVVVEAGSKKSFTMPIPRPGTKGLGDYEPVSVALLP